MAMYKIKKCTYKYKTTGSTSGHSTSRGGLSGASVSGNTESAVMEYLQKKHPRHEITILELIWA